ncbi:flagellar basal body rod protein FlgB [Phaeovibrio sulfidiphilus]|uniref:Flagellar basal body rod protein FlgB n=1 Tax=Phaeovibrio sulfidiphilus TaxID=1220600 RepID=A0A8J7CW33_9PROT|nr:flagellar basal body rod protein FlgB [Phaeovibrio sulfidiphilus]MBE1237051.1 flagellar basal body rod protein FlgB [Phaeovibrio sulfidiphilus]
MSLNNLAIFQMAKMRLDWAAQRQKVLAQNIANADTPGYVAHDVKALDFKKLAASQEHRTTMVRTHVAHQPSVAPSPGPYREFRERYPFESSPDGNEVILEEQMTKLSETSDQYKIASELFKKHLSILKSVSRSQR